MSEETRLARRREHCGKTVDIDALTLARLQFAFTVSFHIIFPAISIGLASYLAVLEGLWLFTGRVVLGQDLGQY